MLLQGEAAGTDRRAAVDAMMQLAAAPPPAAGAAASAAIHVASETAARGLDLPLLTHAINFDVPGGKETYAVAAAHVA